MGARQWRISRLGYRRDDAPTMSRTHAMNTDAPLVRQVRAVSARDHVDDSSPLDSIRALAPHEAARLACELRDCADDRSLWTSVPLPLAPNVRTEWRTSARRPPRGLCLRQHELLRHWRRHLAESAWGVASLLCTGYVAWYASFS